MPRALQHHFGNNEGGGGTLGASSHSDGPDDADDGDRANGDGAGGGAGPPCDDEEASWTWEALLFQPTISNALFVSVFNSSTVLPALATAHATLTASAPLATTNDGFP